MTIKDRSDALGRGLDLVLQHHAAPQAIRDALSKQLHAYLDDAQDEVVWLKRAKWLLSYPLARYLRNDLPAEPDRAFVAAGALRQWMKCRLMVFSRRNTHLWYSWFQAKRSTLPASDSFVEKTYADHFATLTKRDNGDLQTIDEIFSDGTFRRLLKKVRDEIAEELRTCQPFEVRSGSASASFEATRATGGQTAALRTLAKMDDHVAFTDELVSMRFDPCVFGRSTRYNVVTEVRSQVGMDYWESLTQLRKEIDVISPNKCTIQAVLEPMKVRVISKGEALPYYTCRPLQKAMFHSLSKLSPFRLIGRPFVPTDMIGLRSRAFLYPQAEWFSVDYSAATDGLSWLYSGRIFRDIIQSLPKSDQDLALKVLGPHALHYPIQGGRGGIEFKGIQQNGQLMGSILSFPILCLANLGLYLRVTRDWQRGWTDQERLDHVLVNGDDMIYAGLPELWQTHIDLGEKVGLKMSIGKAYHHPAYANINSTSVHCDLRNDLAEPWCIDYLNTGLFFGQHKVQGRRDDGGVEVPERECQVVSTARLQTMLARAHMSADPADGLSCNIGTLLQGSLPGKKVQLLKMFLAHHAADLKKECTAVLRIDGRSSLYTRNLFLPKSLGGMGVDAPAGFKFKVTPLDRRVAGSLMKRCTAPFTFQRPLPGYELKELDQMAPVPWVKPRGDKDIFPSLSIDGYHRARRRDWLAGLIFYGPNPSGVILN